MSVRLDLIGIVAKDIQASLRFYRMLGIEVAEPAADEDHVEAKLPNGLRLAWDKVELIKQINPDWVEPVGTRMGLAFLCDSPAEVDAKFAEVTAAGFHGHMQP